MRDVPAMLRPGMMLARLNARIAQKIVDSSETYFGPLALPRISSATFVRTKARIISMTF